MKNKNWKLARINEGLEMTRINGQTIECRKLNWFEKIIYWRKRYTRYFRK